MPLDGPFMPFRLSVDLRLLSRPAAESYSRASPHQSSMSESGSSPESKPSPAHPPSRRERSGIDRRHAHNDADPHRHDAILKAVYEAASRLLRSTAWQDDILEVLGHLGQAAGASRAFLFQMSRNDAGSLIATWRQEWMAPGISP